LFRVSLNGGLHPCADVLDHAGFAVGFPPPKRLLKKASLLRLNRTGVTIVASDEAAWVSGAVLLISGGAVYTSDPYRYLMKLGEGPL
jgi:hypothetical protein